MTPNYIKSAPSPFPVELKQDQYHQPFIPSPQASSSNSLSCHIFFSSTQDQSAYHQQAQYQQDAENPALHGGSYDLKHEGLKLSLWKTEDRADHQSENSPIPVKWMSSKMRLVQKMKSSDRVGVEVRDQKQPSSPLETDRSSNSSSNNTNTPIRVCADCNTTKTPLWRSGPRGPKSLCNACGIRQRKARRAMAAAAAAAEANGTILAAETSPAKTKVHQKEKIKNTNGHGAQYKKRCKLTAGSSDGQKKRGFEDFLLNLSKNLALHSMFPQDEKDAAILLMALSCGLVNG